MKSLSFFKGLSWLILLNLIVKPVWIFFIDRQVQNSVGHEAYGEYFSVLNLSFVLLFLADAGLTNMLNQRIANHISVNMKQLFRIKFSLLIVYAITCCFVAWLTHIDQWDLFLYLILIQALTSLFVFLRSIITANQYFTADAWFSIVDKLLMVIFCGAVLYTSLFGKIDLVLFLQIQAGCTGTAVLIASWFIAKKQLVNSGAQNSNDRIFRLLQPFALIILLMGIHFRLDGFLLERIHHRGAYEAGIYASAYRLLDAGSMVGYLAASFLVPFVARHQNDKTAIEDAVINTRHGLIFFAIGVVTFTVMFAPWLQQILYHSADPYNSLVIQLCIASLPAYFLVHLYGSMLTATALFNLFIAILFLSVLINIILNLLLIPSKGALGCCIAALASQYFCGIATYIVATKKLNISFAFKSNIIYLFAAVLLTGFFYFGKTSISNVWLILAVGVFICLLFLTTQLSFFKKYFILFH